MTPPPAGGPLPGGPVEGGAILFGMAKIQMYSSDGCPYCVRAKRLLDRKGVEFEEIRMALWDGEARQRLVDLTGRYTVPQILIDDAPIGGYDELQALEDAGRLDELLGRAA
jgi:glutaredoxin 3